MASSAFGLDMNSRTVGPLGPPHSGRITWSPDLRGDCIVLGLRVERVSATSLNLEEADQADDLAVSSAVWVLSSGLIGYWLLGFELFRVMGGCLEAPPGCQRRPSTDFGCSGFSGVWRPLGRLSSASSGGFRSSPANLEAAKAELVVIPRGPRHLPGFCGTQAGAVLGPRTLPVFSTS